MQYTVTFTQCWSYDVDAKTMEEAEDLAYKKFEAEMLRPVAHTGYDEVEIDPEYDEDDLDGEEDIEEGSFWSEKF